MKKFTNLSVIIKHLYFFILLVSSVSCSLGYLDKNQVNEILTDYKKETNKDSRVKIIKNLLSKMKSPGNKKQDEVLDYLTDTLSAEFIKSKDESILIAIDNTDIDGGFANSVCTFYRKVSKESEFIKRYKNTPDNLKFIKRCEGISFSKDEINKMFE
jgi:hypothetical protein